MTIDPKSFISEWVTGNINIEASDDERRVDELTAQLVADAAAEGISEAALDEAVADMLGNHDDLKDYVRNVMEQRTDAEVDRLAGKDEP